MKLISIFLIALTVYLHDKVDINILKGELYNNPSNSFMKLHSDTISRGSSPLRNAKIPNQRNDSLSLNGRICAYGIDSLTDGASGESFRDYFDDVWLGDSSSQLGFVWLNLADTKYYNLSFGTNLTAMINKSDFSKAPIRYSLCGKGLYQLDGRGGYINLNTLDKNFDGYRLYFLQQPGGGTFGAGFSNTNTDNLVSVDTDGPFGIKYIEINRKFGDTKIASIKQINGNCAFFAIDFEVIGNSSSVCNIATGGMTMKKINDLDHTFRQLWFSIINPDVLLLNAGSNDQRTASNAEIKSWIGKYVQDVKSSAPTCRIILVQPNQTSAWNSSNAAGHYEIRKRISQEENIEFFDTIKIIGDYDFFVENDMMLDGTHPNEKGCRRIAKEYTCFLGL